MAETVGRVCDVDGCGRRHLARGLCSTHYNRSHQPNRHRKVIVQCAWCGSDCEKEPTRAKRYGNLFCSDRCKTMHRLSTPDGQEALRRAQAASAQADHRWSARRRAVLKLSKAAEGVRGWGVWTAGPCAKCGEYFVRHSTHLPTRWCSARCRNAFRTRARDLDGLDPREIFERDGWRCHLCGRLTDRAKKHPHPKAPTIDHLVPQADGGDHDPANLATAHSLCNSQRRQFGTVQLALIG